jgi:ACDE family multidrug resistance protein
MRGPGPLDAGSNPAGAKYIMEKWISDTKELLNDRILVLLAAGSFLCISGINLISPALPTIAEGLAVSDSQIGLVITLFTLPSIFILPFAGYLSDNIGRAKIMLLGSLLMGLSGTFTFFANSLIQVLVLRVIQGIGFAGVMPLTVTVLGDLYPGSKQSQAQGFRDVSNKIGDVIWPIAGGLLAVLGWNTPFLAYIVFIPIGIIFYYKVPSYQNNAERRDVSEYLREMKTVIKRPNINSYLFLGFIRMFIKFSIITYVPLLLVSRYSISSGTVGLYISLLGLGGIIPAISAGLIDEKLGSKSLPFSLILIGLSTLLIAFTSSIHLVLLAMLLYGILDSIFAPIQKSLINQSVEGKNRAGAATTNSMMQNIGATTAPVVVGSLFFLGSEIWLYIVTISATIGTLHFIVTQYLDNH